MKKISFGKLLSTWFVAAFVLVLINMFFIKVPMLNNIIMASLGVILLIYPVYPESLAAKYDHKKCVLLIRIAAILEILVAFWIRINF